jgi:hypothetical protein
VRKLRKRKNPDSFAGKIYYFFPSISYAANDEIKTKSALRITVGTALAGENPQKRFFKQAGGH